jgi:hypothetical protein
LHRFFSKLLVSDGIASPEHHKDSHTFIKVLPPKKNGGRMKAGGDLSKFRLMDRRDNKLGLWLPKTLTFRILRQAETLDARHRQFLQVFGGVEIGLVRMAAVHAQKPVAPAITPVPFAARRTALRGFPRVFVFQDDPVFLAVPLNPCRRGPDRANGTGAY